MSHEYLFDVDEYKVVARVRRAKGMRLDVATPKKVHAWWDHLKQKYTDAEQERLRKQVHDLLHQFSGSCHYSVELKSPVEEAPHAPFAIVIDDVFVFYPAPMVKCTSRQKGFDCKLIEGWFVDYWYVIGSGIDEPIAHDCDHVTETPSYWKGVAELIKQIVNSQIDDYILYLAEEA